MGKGNQTAGILGLICCLLALAACDAVLGPPGYEAPIASNEPGAPIPLDMVIEGEPNLNFITAKGGYYIWRTGDIWNIRIAKTDIPHMTFPRDIFVGTVSIENGFIANVMKQSLRPFDEVRSTPNDILFKMEFEKQREVRGISFRVQPMGVQYCVDFDLKVNGTVNPQFVYLGRSLYVPQAIPVRVCVRT